MSEGLLRVAVLISGTGSNLKVLIDGMKSGALKLNIVKVISNRKDAAGLEHAIKASIPVSVISQIDFPERDAHDAAIDKALQTVGVELIILAGYMRVLGKGFTRKYDGRLINLHPSLLPLYKGLDTYHRVLEAGDSETGASVHFVSAGLDSGAVISQIRIPVFADDDVKSLRTRLGPLEHKLVTATVDLFCQKRVQYQHDQVMFDGKFILEPLLLNHDGTFH